MRGQRGLSQAHNKKQDRSRQLGHIECKHVLKKKKKSIWEYMLTIRPWCLDDPLEQLDISGRIF